MKHARFLVILAACATLTTLRAAEPDPLAVFFHPPDLALKEHEALGLRPEQAEKITDLLHQAGQDYEPLKDRLEAAKHRLAKTLAANGPESDEALAALDEFLKIEREGKRLHLKVLLDIRRVLTPEQREKLIDLAARQAAAGPQTAERPVPGKQFEERIKTVREFMETSVFLGHEPREVMEIVELFKAAVKEGDYPRANELLDQAVAKAKFD